MLLLWFFLSHGSSGGNGIFSRRQDFSSFNSLPRHKLNSYHIKVRSSLSFVLLVFTAVYHVRIVLENIKQPTFWSACQIRSFCES
jgi:hypothetical protein